MQLSLAPGLLLSQVAHSVELDDHIRLAVAPERVAAKEHSALQLLELCPLA